MDWQPIETAPKMRVILLFTVTDIQDGVVKNWKMATGVRLEYERGEGEWEWDGRKIKKYDHQPTHWMPLPEPPP